MSLAWDVVATNAVLAFLLMVLIGFPAELFNKTLEENYDEICGWFRPRRRGPRARRVPPALSVVAFSVVGGALYVALDPGTTDDRPTLALAVGMVVAIGAVTMGFEGSHGLFLRRAAGAAGGLRAFPATLVVAVACVVMSRAANFQPGYLYGLVAGWVLFDRRSRTDPAQQGHAVAVSSLALLSLSLAAWAVWTPLDRAAGGPDPSLGLLMLDSALAATFVAGLESLAFGLLPIRFLDGHALATWSRPAWVALQGVALFCFLHVLVNPATAALDVSGEASVISVIALFAAFGTVSVALWAGFRYRATPLSRAPRPATWPGRDHP